MRVSTVSAVVISSGDVRRHLHLRPGLRGQEGPCGWGERFNASRTSNLCSSPKNALGCDKAPFFPVASKERGAGRTRLRETKRKKFLEKRLRKRFSSD